MQKPLSANAIIHALPSNDLYYEILFSHFTFALCRHFAFHNSKLLSVSVTPRYDPTRCNVCLEVWTDNSLIWLNVLSMLKFWHQSFLKRNIKSVRLLYLSKGFSRVTSLKPPSHQSYDHNQMVLRPESCLGRH